jgi:hypothetical protein
MASKAEKSAKIEANSRGASKKSQHNSVGGQAAFFLQRQLPPSPWAINGEQLAGGA